MDLSYTITPKPKGAPKRYFLFSLLLLYCLCSSSKAASAVPNPVRSAADTVSATASYNRFYEQFFREDSLSCVIPFTKAGNLILIKARADTAEGNFILDTGAPHLVLNMVYFRDYPITVVADEHQTSISGTADIAHKTKLRSFSFGALEFFQTEADLVDLGHIENSKGVKILGLIGFGLLQQCEMIIDYEKNLIYLHRLGRKERNSYKHALLQEASAYTTLPIEIKDRKIIAQTEMAGKKLRLVLDSGAETNILDSRLPEKLLELVEITGRFNIRGTGNTTIEALRGNASSMTIGGQDMGNLPVLIANLDQTCFSLDACVNGVLGFEFLPLKKLGFNFVTRKMYLWK